MDDVDVEQADDSGDVAIKTPSSKTGQVFGRDERAKTYFTEEVAREVRDQLDAVLSDGDADGTDT